MSITDRSTVVRLAAATWLCLGLCAVLSAAGIGKLTVHAEGEGAEAASLEAVVRSNIESLPDTEFSPRTLTEDVRRLYRTGNFEDVRTQALTMDDGRLEIVVTVVPKRLVRAITVEGAVRVKTKILRGLVEHPIGVPVDQVKLAADAQAMRRKYEGRGYYSVEIETRLQPIPNTNDVNVIFRVSEPQRAKLKGVDFEGLTVFSKRHLRRRIHTKRPWWRYILRWGNYFDEGKLTRDKDALTEIYREAGYLDFSLTKVEPRFNRRGTWVTVVFHVHEGSPYTLGGISVSGNERFSSDELLEAMTCKTGDTYSSSREGEDVEAMRRKYEVLGYLDLRCYPVHRNDPDRLVVDVEYKIQEGVPSRIRDIFIVGNEITKDHVIRRELSIHPGDLGDAGKVRASESRLKNLNYFETVEILPLATEQDDLRDLRIQLQEKRTGTLMLGAGFSSEDSVVGFVEVTQSNFDWRNWPSFRGGGQRMRARTQVGTERLDFTVSFTEPWWLNRRLRLSLDAFASSRYEENYDDERIGAGARLSWRLWRRWTQSVGFRVQQIDLTDFDGDVSDELAAEEDTYWANRLMFGLRRDSRNRFLYPSRGSVLSLNLEVTPEALGSYSNIYSLNLSADKYLPVTDEHVLKLSSEIGIVDKVSGDEPAIFDRLFAGGTYSVRGFDRREISPVDTNENEDELGGKSMLLAKAEYFVPLGDRVRVSVFCDAGNVWPDVDELTPSEMNVSVGVGLQLNLPIGPIRFDYGYPIHTELDHLDGNSGRLHFNIGYSF